MSASAIVAGRASIEAKIDGIAKAVADLGRLNKGMKRTAQATSSMAKATKVARGALAGLVAFNIIQRNISKFVQSLNQAVNAIDQIDKASKRLGMTAQEFQQLSIATQLSGVEFEQLQTGIGAMQRQIGQLAMGASEAADTFGALDISFADLQGKTTTEQLSLITDELNKFSSPTEKAAMAMRLFGRGGMRLLPFLEMGSKGFKELAENVQTLTGGLQQTTVDSMVEIKDLFTVLGEAQNIAKADFFAQFLEVIRAFVLGILAAAKTLREVEFGELFGGMFDGEFSEEDITTIAKNLVTAVLSLAAGLRLGAGAMSYFTLQAGLGQMAMGKLLEVVGHIVHFFTGGAFGDSLKEAGRNLSDFGNTLAGGSWNVLSTTLTDTNQIFDAMGQSTDLVEENSGKIKEAWDNAKIAAEKARQPVDGMNNSLGEANDNLQKMKTTFESFKGQALVFDGDASNQQFQANRQAAHMAATLEKIERNTRDQVQIETY